MLANAIYQRLAGHAPLAALVGTRIYPSRAPDEAQMPYLVYLDMAPIDQAEDLDGSGGLDQVRVQVDAWATSAIEAKRVGDLARAALRDFRGAVAGVSIANVTISGGFDDWDGGSGDTPSVAFRRSTDFLVWKYT